MTNPLQKLIAVDADARSFGFEWPHATMVLDKVRSEAEEIRTALAGGETPQRIQEEAGDLLHSVISLCLFLQLDVDQTLDLASAKLQTRINALKALAQQQGLNTLKGQTIEFKLNLWSEVKSLDQT